MWPTVSDPAALGIRFKFDIPESAENANNINTYLRLLTSQIIRRTEQINFRSPAMKSFFFLILTCLATSIATATFIDITQRMIQPPHCSPGEAECFSVNHFMCCGPGLKCGVGKCVCDGTVIDGSCCPPSRACGKTCCAAPGPFFNEFCASAGHSLCCTTGQVNANGICCNSNQAINCNGQCCGGTCAGGICTQTSAECRAQNGNGATCSAKVPCVGNALCKEGCCFAEPQ